ncbi:MAG: hypothetical protein ACFFD4_34765 [Candidatus Odinarchaeota archaeon]
MQVGQDSRFFSCRWQSRGYTTRTGKQVHPLKELARGASVPETTRARVPSSHSCSMKNLLFSSQLEYFRMVCRHSSSTFKIIGDTLQPSEFVRSFMA